MSAENSDWGMPLRMVVAEVSCQLWSPQAPIHSPDVSIIGACFRLLNRWKGVREFGIASKKKRPNRPANQWSAHKASREGWGEEYIAPRPRFETMSVVDAYTAGIG